MNRLTLRQRIILACSVACAGVILGVWHWRYGWGKDYLPPKPFSAFAVASDGTEAQLQRAITRRADFNVMVSDDTPLYHTAETNPNPDAVRFLIDQTHSLNEYDRKYRLNKALAIAAMRDQSPEVISVLLEAGAYKDYLSWEYDRTLYAPPLFLAAKRNRNPEVTRVLLDAEDAAVRKLILDGTIRYNGKNILMCAIHNTKYTVSVNVLRFLISAGVNINARNLDNETVLMERYTPSGRDVELITMKELLDAGADPNIQAKNGKTALMKQVVVTSPFIPDVDIVELLINNGANLELRDNAGQTALMLAVQNKYSPSHMDEPFSRGVYGVIRLLLNAGADIKPETTRATQH